MRTKANLARHEWIGLAARVERAADPSLVGAEGRVVDETLRTVTLERPSGREVRLQKQGSQLSLSLPGGERATLDLSGLEMRPADRVKRAKSAKATA
jgi:ribonuclease P protein subunit POP4